MQTVLHDLQVGLDGMNLLDWIIAMILVLSTITGFMRGLIRSLISLVGVLAGVLAAARFAPQLAGTIARWIAPHSLALMVAFVLILLGVYALAVLLGRLLSGACSAVGLGFLDRLAGAVFGFARGVLMLAALLLPLGPYLQHFAAARSSALLPYLLPATHEISFVVPRDFAEHSPAADWLHHSQSAVGRLLHQATQMPARLR